MFTIFWCIVLKETDNKLEHWFADMLALKWSQEKIYSCLNNQCCTFWTSNAFVLMKRENQHRQYIWNFNNVGHFIIT